MSIELIINPPVIAHRGASAYAPENTLAAFLRAKELGITWVEFDVMLSADGEVVVIHDATLNRTTSGRGYVKDFPYSYLAALDAGSWFNKDFAQERILTLKQTIAFLNKHNMSANIEIKPLVGQEEETVKKVLSDIQVAWKNKQNPPLISSFSFSVLKYVRYYSTDSWIGLLLDKWEQSWEKKCDDLQCISINVNHKILTQARVKQIKEKNKTLLCYTVDDLARAKKLCAWGVDAVFSNMPDKILTVWTKIN